MRGVASYVIAGFLVGLAINFVVPLGFSPVAATPAAVNTASLQSVDRSNKGDRGPITVVGKSLSDKPAAKMLTNCDPAFSPLSASARVNFARSCAV